MSASRGPLSLWNLHCVLQLGTSSSPGWYLHLFLLGPLRWAVSYLELSSRRAGPRIFNLPVSLMGELGPETVHPVILIS